MDTRKRDITTDLGCGVTLMSQSVNIQAEGTGAYMPKGDSLDYVRRIYRVDVELGQRVECDGKPGTVVFDPRFGSHYVHVEFDDGHRSPCHPTWRMVYR